jgi:DNA polymerase III subunit epsilon
MNWHQGRMASLDFETTGVSAQNDRIVSAALHQLGGGVEPVKTPWLVNPGVPIPASATAIHNITDAMVALEGTPAQVAVESIAAAVASVANRIPLVVFQAPFDLTMLHAECVRHGVPTVADRIGGPLRWVIDPLVIDKHISWRKGKRTLVAAAEHYGIQLGDDAHGAAADALAAARVAWKIASQNPKIAAMSLNELHDAQVTWKAEQNASFQAYKRKTDPDFTAETGWPLYDLATGGAES